MIEPHLLYHIVLTLHNSRTSRRMMRYGIKKGPVEYLSLEAEIELAKIMKDVLKALNLECYAFNVCKDHLHLVIACQEGKLNNMIGQLKGKSAYLYNSLKQRKGAFWSQKFYVANLDNWTIGSAWSNTFNTRSSYFQNAVAYIKNNRVKHDLPESDELKEIIESFVINE